MSTSVFKSIERFARQQIPRIESGENLIVSAGIFQIAIGNADPCKSDSAGGVRSLSGQHSGLHRRHGNGQIRRDAQFRGPVVRIEPGGYVDCNNRIPGFIDNPDPGCERFPERSPDPGSEKSVDDDRVFSDGIGGELKLNLLFQFLRESFERFRRIA